MSEGKRGKACLLKLARSAEDWPWSSYRATPGMTEPHFWQTTDWVQSSFEKDRKSSRDKYREFVRQGETQPSFWASLKNQFYLGSDNFAETMQCKINSEQSLLDMLKPQKQSPSKPFEFHQLTYADRC